MFKRLIQGLLPVTLAAAILSSPALAEDRSIIVQSTTSTQNSGLYDVLLPIFETKTGIKVNVVAVGTGQAIKNAQNGDGDVLLVHAKPSEEKFVAEGWGVERFDVMYNDFIIVGPPSDPAHIAGSKDAVAALKAIAGSKSLFASRGDNFGTNKKFGRVGDSPVIGAGTWAWDRTCAISCTGSGEYFLRGVVAYDVSCLMEYRGLSLEAACQEVIHKRLLEINGDGGLIAIDRQGNIALPFNTEGMYRASVRAGEAPFVGIYGD